MLSSTRFGFFAAGGGGEIDPYFSSVSILLHFNDTDGSTNITDSGPNSKIIAVQGSAEIDTAQSKFGGSSLMVPGGTGDGLQIADDDIFEFGSGDFTLETFIRFTSLPSSSTYQIIAAKGNFSGSQRGWLWGLYNDGGTYKMLLSYTTNGSTFTLTYSSGLSISINTWYHFAATVSSGTARYFVDGIQYGSNSYGPIFNGSDNLWICTRDSSTTQDVYGHIDDLRITKGVSRYNTSFIVTTSQFPDQ